MPPRSPTKESKVKRNKSKDACRQIRENHTTLKKVFHLSPRYRTGEGVGGGGGLFPMAQLQLIPCLRMRKNISLLYHKPPRLIQTYFYLLMYQHAKKCGSGSVDGIATGYGLDGPGIEFWWRRNFPHLSRPALGPTQSPVQRVQCLSRG